MEKEESIQKVACADTEGTMPTGCAALAYPYIAMQSEDSERYDRDAALKNGTLFPGLDLPFHKAMKSRFPAVRPALLELMALDFALDEMELYLDTHPNDREALALFRAYLKLSNQGREKYQRMYGPLQQSAIGTDGRYSWINDPWPWEQKGADD